jgi:hypothetical protein
MSQFCIFITNDDSAFATSDGVLLRRPSVYTDETYRSWDEGHDARRLIPHGGRRVQITRFRTVPNVEGDEGPLRTAIEYPITANDAVRAIANSYDVNESNPPFLDWVWQQADVIRREREEAARV